MRTLRIYSLNFYICRVVLIYQVVHYIHSTYLSHNWKFVPFDCLHRFALLLTPISDNCKSAHLFFEFVCF